MQQMKKEKICQSLLHRKLSRYNKQQSYRAKQGM